MPPRPTVSSIFSESVRESTLLPMASLMVMVLNISFTSLLDIAFFMASVWAFTWVSMAESGVIANSLS